jgi:hypothetical protein
MRAIARYLTVFSLVALLALLGSALLAAGAEAAPTGNPPTITGPTSPTTSPQVGDTLTDVSGGWTGTGTVNVVKQWMDCDSSGTGCAHVAANGTGQTYTLALSDIGSTIEVQETATDTTPGSTMLSSGPTAVVGLPPVNTSLPTVSGGPAPKQGQTLTETNGAWTNNPTSFSHQWLRCDNSGKNCAAILGATDQTYTLTSADVNNTVAVEVTASNAGGPGSPADSASTAVVLTATTPVPVNQTLPTISRTAQVGQTLIETNGSWSPTPTGFSHQWLDCNSSGNNCTSVAANGSGPTYVVASTDVGSTIRVAETASNAGGAGTAVDSAPSAVVVPATTAVPVNQALPTISGTAQLGQTLIEGHGSWSPAPTSYGYQWLRCDSSGHSCATILSATGQSYRLTSADVNNTIEVEEIASNAGSSGTADSTPTAIITAPVVTTVNSTLTALLVVPGSPVTNQTANMIATVTSSSPGAPPAGALTFETAGAPIGGCSIVPVATFNQSVNVTCPTAFSASTSPEHLTAVFTAAAGSNVTGSTSQTVTVVVGQASTSTTLDVSNPTVFDGSKATYTATVAAGQASPFAPSGSVKFSDHGKPIASCSSQALAQSQGSLSAQCTVRYRKTGQHTITALYSGDRGFSGSASAPQAVRVEQQSPTIQGAITAKTHWTFRFTLTYTMFTSMRVHKLRPGTTIVLICRGHGCPAPRQSLRVTTKACGPNAQCVTEKDQLVDLFPRLRGHRLSVGTVLTIELTRPNWIGKAYVITIRSGRKPPYRILCLKPGSTRPGVGC